MSTCITMRLDTMPPISNVGPYRMWPIERVFDITVS